jgi:hypothetical protein
MTRLSTARRVIVAFLVLLAAAMFLVALCYMQSARAGEGCGVTRHEFMSAPYAHKARVEAFWGTGPGRRSDHVFPASPRFVAYDYPTCVRGGWVTVVYRETTLQAQQFWLMTPGREG